MIRFNTFILSQKLLLLPVLAAAMGQFGGWQAVAQIPAQGLHAASQPATTLIGAKKPETNPCELKNTAASLVATAALWVANPSDSNEAPAGQSSRVINVALCVPHLPMIDWYARFLNGPQVRALTPGEKAHLAGRNLLDPFNLLTIFGEAAISVAANPHSAYGPGMPGYGRYVGVSFTQNMVGEFFGTFLIPSIAHQDPHYHRMPKASIPRRVVHAITQIAWTQGDDGNGMLNYADLVGFAADDAIGNLYVPGQQTNLRASTERYGIALASAPIDNFITEFLPDVARHIHLQVVVIQRVINRVARTDNNGGP